jgi:hypothetical protein
MISTRLSSTAAVPASCTAGAIAMERQSVTAPDYRSVHGTGLPFAGSTLVAAQLTNKARAAVAQMGADVPGSPPRGGPV